MTINLRKNETLHTGVITNIKRLVNTHVGNPRYAITLTEQVEFENHEAFGEVTYKTSPNSMFCYNVDTKGMTVGDMVSFSVNGRGSISGMEASK